MSVELLHFAQIALSAVLMLGGVFFVLAGAVGVLRLPDFYTRMHAAGITDTLGAEMIIFGLIVQTGISQNSLKLILIAFLLFLTSPTATHAVVGAAHHAGLKPMLGKYKAPVPREVGSREVGSREVGSREVGSREVGSGKISSGEAVKPEKKAK